MNDLANNTASANVPLSFYFGAESGFAGANTSTRRGQVTWEELDTRKDLHEHARIELYKRTRWLGENVGFVKNLKKGIATLRGYQTPYSSTTSDEWNDLVDDYIMERGGDPLSFDVAGKFDLFSAQEVLSNHELTDGDHCTILTESESGGAMVHFLESHQLRNPSSAKAKGWYDGVKLNRLGKHLGYNFHDFGTGNEYRVPARDLILFGGPSRTGHHRAIPPLAHAINHAIDVTEIWSDVKTAIKTSGLFGAIITGAPTKGATSHQAGAAQKLMKGKTASGQEYEYEQIEGAGHIMRMAQGGEVKTVKDARPHQNQRDLITDLIRDIYAGTGYPPEVLWHLGGNTGPEVRFLMARAKKQVMSDRAMLNRWVKRVRMYMIAKGIKNGDLPTPRSNFKWWKCVTMPQADPTIDRSRDRSDWDMVLGGGMSPQTFFAERGIYWKDHLDQLVAVRTYFGKAHPNHEIRDFMNLPVAPVTLTD